MFGLQRRSDAVPPGGEGETAALSGRASAGPGLLLLLFNGLLLSWLLVRPAGGAVIVAVDNVAQFTGPLLMLLLFMRGRANRSPEEAPGRRRVAVLLACGVGCYCAGQIVYTYYEQILNQPAPSPSWADVGYLSLYPFLFSATLLLPACPTGAAARLGLAVDGLLLLAVVAAYSWYFIMYPTMAGGGDSILVKAVAVAYPLCDLLVFRCVLVLWARLGRGAPQPTTGLLSGALAVIVVTDSIWQYKQLHGTYATGSLLDIGWPVGYMAIGLAAYTLRAPAAPGGQDPVAGHSAAGAGSLARALLPFGATLAIGILALYAWYAPAVDGSAARGVYIGALLLTALVLVRQATTIVENRQLYRRLDEAYTAQGQRLASRVADLEWVRDVTRQITAARSMHEVLDAAYTGIRSGLGYDRVGINLWDVAAGIFEDWVGTDTAGRQIWPADRQLSLSPDSPLWRFPGMASMLRGESLYVTEAAYEECPPELRYLYDGEPRHSMMVALRGGERTVGMISMDNLISGRPIAVGEAAPLLALANQIGLAVERAALVEAERAHGEEAEAMARVSAALAGTLEPGQLYGVIFEQASAMLPCDHMEVTLYQDGWLTLVANAGSPCVPVPFRMMRTEQSLLARDLVRDVPRYIADTAEEQSWQDVAPWIGRYRLRSLIAIPLLIDGNVGGSFNVASFEPRRYTPRHIQLATSFGERVGQAVRNARLYATEQERARAAEELAQLRQQQAEETAALTRASMALGGIQDPSAIYRIILEQAASMVPCANACMWLFDQGWAHVGATWGEPNLPLGTRAFPLDAHVAELWPVVGGGPLYIADTSLEATWDEHEPWTGTDAVRSIIKVPLGIGGELLGCFDMASTLPDAYEERHLRLAAAFGERAEQAVRNARLYAAEQERARAAEELAGLRSDFVASVSHELRTPLTAIVGFAELLVERWEHTGDEQRLATVRKIAVAANRQQRMVEELLLLGRIEAGSLTVALREAALGELVRRAVEEVQAAYRGQRIDLQGPADLMVVVDADRTVQVLINVLDNAAKYSPEGQPIEVRWEEQEGMVCVQVRDRGQGVPERGREALFTRFGRLPGSKPRSGRVGTGLGLYLSRQFATTMDGTLELESSAPTGSTFALRLPLAPAGQTHRGTEDTGGTEAGVRPSAPVQSR